MRADDLLHGQAEIALDVLDGCSKQCTTSAVTPCHKPLHNSMQCSDLLVMLHDLLSKQSLCVADLPYGLCHVVIWPAFSHLAQPFMDSLHMCLLPPISLFQDPILCSTLVRAPNVARLHFGAAQVV